MITINHDCEGPLPGGFFSKLLIVLDWIHNSIYQKEKVKVNWTCLDKLDHNIWDYLFEDPQLDNDETKQDKRLYGTNLIVSSPKILEGVKNPKIILCVATYKKEIESDILTNINKDAIFIHEDCGNFI